MTLMTRMTRIDEIVASIAKALDGCALSELMRLLTDIDGDASVTEHEYTHLCDIAAEALNLHRVALDGGELTSRAKLREAENALRASEEEVSRLRTKTEDLEVDVEALRDQVADLSVGEPMCKQVLLDAGFPPHGGAGRRAIEVLGGVADMRIEDLSWPAPVTSASRVGDWAQTFTGRKFWPADPRIEDIDLRDIAHALARICRFGGHTPEHNSVAQHSVLVSRICPPSLALVGLCHDATEAYLGDIIRPLKELLPEYRRLEDLWALTIGQALGLGDQLLHLPREVKDADRAALETERRDVVTQCATSQEWRQVSAPAPWRIVPLSAAAAEQDFLARWGELAELPRSAT